MAQNSEFLFKAFKFGQSQAQSVDPAQANIGNLIQSTNDQVIQSFYECGQSTKINCIITGPTQKSFGQSQPGDKCQIKVSVNFINSISFSDPSEEKAQFPIPTILLDQFPDVKE